MSGGGFFVTARKVFDHNFAGPYCEGFAWLWMISEAAWQDGPTLQRGQLSISRRTMAQRFGWSDKKIRAFLARLKAENMIETRGPLKGPLKGPTPSVITICNYNKYQTVKAPKGPLKGPLKGPIEKEENKLTKERKNNLRRVEADHDLFFENFWKAFPKRDGDNPKAKARSKFLQLTKAGTDPGELIAAAQRYAGLKRSTERKFIPQAITWLNQQRWQDVPANRPEDAPWSDEERERRFAELRRKA